MKNTETYSTACALPNPRDVKTLPSSSLFINSVMNCDAEVLNRVDQNNYASFIAAIARATRDFANNEAKIEHSREVANTLLRILIEHNIEYETSDSKIKLLLLMSNLSLKNFDKFRYLEVHTYY